MVRSGGGKGQAAPKMRVSYIDLEHLKGRYAGKALTQEEIEEQEQMSRRVRDGGRELSIFGEDEPEERNRRAYTLVGIFFLVALLIGIGATLYFLLIIDRIDVTGNETLEKGEVLTIAGINIGEHMWLADVEGARAALEADAAIRSAQVKRMYPDALSITIEERVPVAYMEGSGTGAVIDIEGYVMDITPAAPPELIVIYGFSSAGFQMGQRLGQYSEFNSATLLEILTALSGQGILESIDSVDMSQPLRISMSTADGYTINVGQPDNMGDKLENLGLVLSKVRSMGYVGGSIDVGVLGDPVYSPPVSAAPEDEPAEGEGDGEGDGAGEGEPAPEEGAQGG